MGLVQGCGEYFCDCDYDCCLVNISVTDVVVPPGRAEGAEQAAARHAASAATLSQGVHAGGVTMHPRDRGVSELNGAGAGVR